MRQMRQQANRGGNRSRQWRVVRHEGKQVRIWGNVVWNGQRPRHVALLGQHEGLQAGKAKHTWWERAAKLVLYQPESSQVSELLDLVWQGTR